jgi:transposase-like protein
MMDPQQVFCPNMDCPARGKVGAGNIGVHSRKERRYICHVCDQTFAETTGTPFYRLKKAKDVVTVVVTLLSNGCPVQAIVAAFGLDERTVRDWDKRAGHHAQAVHEHLVEQPREVGQVQADELRVKQQGHVVWMAMAVMVKTRLWLGGHVSAKRDLVLITAVIEKVRRSTSALTEAILFCTDGLKSYVTAVRQVFREPDRSGTRGRPGVRSWPNICLAQTIKQYAQGRVVGVVRRIIQGTAEQIQTVIQQSQGRGTINVAFIERLNATFRQRLNSLCRRGRALARQTDTLQWGMYLVGAIYNFCTDHRGLRLPGLVGGHKWLSLTPAMAAGITDHRWTVEELLMFHVPPPPWSPPKRRGRPSRATKLLVARWCT